MLPINFDFKLASSVENFGGTEGYLLHFVRERGVISRLPRTSKFVGTKI